MNQAELVAWKSFLVSLRVRSQSMPFKITIESSIDVCGLLYADRQQLDALHLHCVHAISVDGLLFAARAARPRAGAALVE